MTLDERKTTGDAPPFGAWAFVVLSLLCSTLAYLDRQFVSLIVGPLEQTLHINDTQAGLLQGLAFSLFYAVAGLPLALAIDRGPRVRIAAGCVTVWSLATAACGMMTAFVPFLGARALTAASEAGFSPAVLSMIADRFPRRRIPAATAIYLMAPPAGTAAALFVGGALLGHFNEAGGLTLPGLGHLLPWQAVFVTLMVPGLVLALMFVLVVREPLRRDVRFSETDKPPEVSSGRGMSALISDLRANRGLLLIYVLAISIIMMSTFAQSAWAPTLFARRFDLPLPKVGHTLGPIFMAASILGAVFSSLIAGRSSDRHVLSRVVLIILIFAGLLPFAVVGLCLATSYKVALSFYGLSGLVAGIATSLATAPIQLTASAQARAQSIAVGGFLLAVIGAGGGPFFVGFLTDHLFGDPSAVGQSLALVAVASAVAGLPLMLVAWRRAKSLAATVQLEAGQ